MEELIYRPPFEANSFLLQVTHGCSHNKCAFCTMYRDIPFSIVPKAQITAQLEYAAKYEPDCKRIFLENGDPFTLSAEKLLEIAEEVHRYLPMVETIAMYASIKNIRKKTDEELAALRSAGINELNIGVESGLDDALLQMNKGYTAEEASHELLRLRAAGIDYGANIIFGAAGSGNWKENAEATAKLLNETTPYLIFTGTIHADPGCPLYEQLQSGAFEENTFGEYLDEEELLLNLLELDDCYYFGLHPSNVVPMHGDLQRGKDLMLKELQKMRVRLQTRLDQKPKRSGEGAIWR